MSEQIPLFKADPTWFHVFKALIDSGDAAAMGGTVFLVYCVIKSHCAFGSGNAFPTQAQISEKSGVGARQVIRALQKLEEMGYVAKTKNWRVNSYTLREKVQIMNKDTGEVAKVASWDYVPDMVGAATIDLKRVLLSGDFGSAKIVHIDNLHVEIKQLITGQNNTGVQINEADLDKLPAEMREGLKARIVDARRRKHS